MGDVGDDYKFLKEINQKRRANNYDAAKLLFLSEDAPVKFTCHTEWHWQLTLLGDLLDYWPSSSKWRWRKQSSHGRPQDLANFICNKIRKDKNGIT